MFSNASLLHHFALSNVLSFAYFLRKIYFVFLLYRMRGGYIEFGMATIAPTSRRLPVPQKLAQQPQIKSYTMKSLFSDNSRVCYKPGSLSYGGVGTMSNGRAKARRT
jgi:hypothetical protein